MPLSGHPVVMRLPPTRQPGHHHEDDHHHDGDHHHEAEPAHGFLARLRHLLRPHSHEPASSVDAKLEASAEGMRALWISFAALGVTTLIQAAVVVLSGSVALLGDTMHNASDALIAIPLAVAFVTRPPTSEPALHLRVWPGGGPGRHRDRADDRAVVGPGCLGGDQQAGSPATGHGSGGRRRSRDCRFRRKRGRR